MKDKNKSATWVHRLCEGDPDLKCPEHDKMSFLLSSEKVVERLIRDAGIDFPNSLIPWVENPEIESLQFNISIEHPVTKGEGQYAVIIGFADCFCSIKLNGKGIQEVYKKGSSTETEKKLTVIENPSKGHCFLIEAKPEIINPMEVLRQLRTYREFISKSTGMLLWCPTITESVAAIFRGQKIYVANTKTEDL